MELRVGTAGWAIPASDRDSFEIEGSQLQRYARVFPCVEINSSFYRPHRASTYARWAESVPDDFRFSLKLPKSITHERRLAACNDLLAAVLDASAALGAKRDVLLVQFPPSFAFDRTVTAAFFTLFRRRYSGRIACEPRHPTWFTPVADALLAEHDVARVAADPVVPGGTSAPGGSDAFSYRRLHGSPRIYYSSYHADVLAALSTTLRSATMPNWCIFDNTAAGAATEDALCVLNAITAPCRVSLCRIAGR